MDAAAALSHQDFHVRLWEFQTASSDVKSAVITNVEPRRLKMTY